MNLDDGKKLLGVVTTLASALDPEAKVFGLTISELGDVAQGIVGGVPEVVAAVGDIEAAVNGGAAPTPDQLLALKASIDANDDQIQKDVAARDASGSA